MDRATLFVALLGCCVPRAPVLHTHVDAVRATSSPYLKAHLHDGGVVVLRDDWEEDMGLLQGRGWALDPNRLVVGTDQPMQELPPAELAVAVADVAVFETAKRKPDPSTYLMGSLAALNVALVSLYVALASL